MRYVYYFENFLELRRKAFPNRVLNKMPRVVMKVLKLRMITIPSIGNGGFRPTFKVYSKNALVYDYKTEGKLDFLTKLPYYDFKIRSKSLLLYDDVKIEFYHKSSKSVKAFHFWFNTSFIDNSMILSLEKSMIEKASSDKKCKKYDRNFRIEVHVSEIKTYEMVDTKFTDKNEQEFTVPIPEEKLNSDEQKLLEMAQKYPKKERRLSI
jgi:phosphatidylinositol-3,4,5-trisphosphate 3-phosphatase/dual-specificity protein phosphatase PTEN